MHEHERELQGEDLVRLWKDPEARADADVPHPAGEIDPGAAARRARRNAVLLGIGGLAVGVVAAALTCDIQTGGTISFI